MKVSLSWLRDFAPFEGDPVALGEVMSDLGHGRRGARPHRRGPRRDRRRPRASRPGRSRAPTRSTSWWSTPATASPSRSAAARSTCRSGDLVPLATVGTMMPNGMEIGRRKMAGVVSNGMLCSSVELGLGDDHGGIYLLPPHLEPGTPFPRRWASSGTSSTTSRSTPTGPTPCRWPASPATWPPASGCRSPCPSPRPRSGRRGPSAVSGGDPRPRPVRPLRGPRAVRACGSGPGDPAIAARLAALGMRSINNVVDVSNYVMLELGPAEPPLRPGQGGRSRVPGPAGPRRRGQLTTLDEVDAHASPSTTSSSATPPTSRSAWPGSWAAATARSTTPPPTSSSRWRGSTRSAS